MSTPEKKTCLVISYGPVPTPQYQKIEGGGMRAWGLAKGLLANGYEVTVAVNDVFPQEINELERVKLVNWAPNEHFTQLLNSYDVVVTSYCMGNDSVFIADHIDDSVLLILDVYVPIYVEVSARNAEAMGPELENYLEDIKRFNHVLKRGDYFICANQTQKIFYTGVLGSLGVINPRSYSQDRILIVPFGIHDTPVKANTNPYTALGIGSREKVILWFGGLYPWFRVQDYLDAILKLSNKHSDMRFVFVGGKNPFNSNPDLLRQYTVAVKFAEKHGLKDKNMFFVDWVDFDTRADWYKYADFVISLNQPGEENGFSWRTRVMDYVWGEVVALTNGGDPLGDQLVEAGAAIRLPNLSTNDIITTVESIYKRPERLETTAEKLRAIKPLYYWRNVTLPLVDKIANDLLPHMDEKNFKNAHGIRDQKPAITTPTLGPSKFHKAAKVPSRVIRHAREKGLKRSLALAAGVTKTQFKKRARITGKQFVFLTHPLDNTGAPMVLLDIISEAKQAYPNKRLRVLASYTTPNNIKQLAEMGIRVEKSAVLSPRLTGLQLGLEKNDFIILNTAAVYENYRNYIFNLLSAGRLKHAFWFIHEDIAQLKVVAPQLMAGENVKRIHRLVSDGKLTILVPSKRVQEDYNELFDIHKVVTVPLQVTVPAEFTKSRVPSDYSKLNFFLSGTPSDGRKGQLIALAAFQHFMDTSWSKHPENYRDFGVHFVSIGDDYVSAQVKTIGQTVLGDRLHIYPSVTRQQALEIAHESNAVICCSLNETFALYVAEGMAMGHVVLRNNSAGIDEQLKDGKNGYYIDSDNVKQFAGVIERLLNKRTLSDKQLAEMGKVSQSIIHSYSDHTYLDKLQELCPSD